MLIPLSIVLLIVFALLTFAVYYMLNKIPKGIKKSPITATPGITKSGAEGLSRSKCLPVYFYDKTAEYFVPIHMPLGDNTENPDIKATRIIDKLISGPPSTSGLQSVMPAGTKLNSVRIEGDLAIVDLNSAVESYGGGSSWEKGIVESLLLSITELPGIKRVQILIDGKTKEYLPEGTPIDKPLERNIGPNADQPTPEGKPSGYMYYLDSSRSHIIPIMWTWDGAADDPLAKLKALYSNPTPYPESLASPAPKDMQILKCEIFNDSLTLVLNHPDFANVFNKLNAQRFLEATYLTLYAVKPFTKADIRVGSGDNPIPLWSYAPFSEYEKMEIPPLCYNGV